MGKVSRKTMLGWMKKRRSNDKHAWASRYGWHTTPKAVLSGWKDKNMSYTDYLTYRYQAGITTPPMTRKGGGMSQQELVQRALDEPGQQRTVHRYRGGARNNPVYKKWQEKTGGTFNERQWSQYTKEMVKAGAMRAEKLSTRPALFWKAVEASGGAIPRDVKEVPGHIFTTTSRDMPELRDRVGIDPRQTRQTVEQRMKARGARVRKRIIPKH